MKDPRLPLLRIGLKVESVMEMLAWSSSGFSSDPASTNLRVTDRFLVKGAGWSGALRHQLFSYLEMRLPRRGQKLCTILLTAMVH